MAERAELEPDARQAVPGHRSSNGVAVEAASATGPHDMAGVRTRGRSGMHPRQVLAMQRLVGNRAVVDALGSNGARGQGDDDETTEATAESATGAEVASGKFGGMAAAADDAGAPTDAAGSASAAAGEQAFGPQASSATAAAMTAGEVASAVAGPRGQSGTAMTGIEEATAGAGMSASNAGGMADLAEGSTAGGPAGAPSAAGAAAGMAASAGAGAATGGLAGSIGRGAAAAGGEEIARRGSAKNADGALEGMSESSGAATGGGGPGDKGTASIEAVGLAVGGAAGAASGSKAGAEAVGDAGLGAEGIGRAAGAETAVAPVRQAGRAAEGAPAGGSAHSVGSEAGGASSHEGAGGAGSAEEPSAGSSGGGGLDAEGPAPHGEPFPDPTVPAAPAPGEINRLGEAPTDLETGEELTAEEEGDAQSEDAPEGEIMGQAEGVAAAGQDGGDGGIVDALINRAKAAFRGVVGTVTGAARAVAGTVTSAVRTAVRGARNLVRGVVNGIVATAQSIKNSVLAGIRSVVSGITSAARSVVAGLLGSVRSAMSAVRGAVMAAIGRAMRGESLVPSMLAPVVGFLHRLFGDIPGQITRLITQLTQTANALVDRLIAGIVALTATIVGSIASIASTLQGAVAAVAGAVTGLAQRATELVGGLPGVLRSAISWLVDRLVAGVRAAVRAIQNIVNEIINAVSARLMAMVGRLAARVIGFINRVRNGVMAAVNFVTSLVRGALSRLAAFRAWLIQGATAMLGRVLRAVVEPLKRALMNLLMQRIGPQIQAAMATARTMFPNGLPSPQEVVQAQTQAAAQAAAQAQESIVNGLLHPEGDHFSIGFQLGGDVSGGAGVSAGAGASLEVVMDYRRGDIGFFVAPGASAQLSVGDIGATGSLSGSMTWGTVGSFGDANKDVLQGWGGWFTNASYGVQGGIAEGGGLAVQSGGVISVGGSTDFGTIGSYTPLGADQHLVPGATVQGPPTPGAKDLHEVVALGEVLFPTQSADVNALGGGGAISTAASTATSYPAGHDGARVISIDVTGEASRAWRHPGAGQSREESNRDLASRRAEAVRARLEPQVPGISVHGIGAGDGAAARAGKAETDASPEDQRATMYGAVFKPGTPDQPGGVTQQPGRMEGDAFQVNAGVPNPLAAGRSAWGWDTSIGVAGLVGEAGRAGVYGGLGASYSFPIGKAHFDATTMAMTRIIFGLVKMLGDVETGSPLGLIRDAIGMGWGVEELVTSSLGQAVGDWTIPLPPGLAVA